MRTFDEIYAIAAGRKGGTEALEALLVRPKSAAELAALPEDRWLAQFTRSIFQSGFNWKVVEAKWPGFEEAFWGFDVDRCAFMDDDAFDAIVANPAVVRNAMKLATVRENAVFLCELRDQGGAGRVLGGWPSSDYIGLLALLSGRGSRLGGITGAYALRFLGRDGFILSRDVVARLVAEGVIDRQPGSKKAMAAVQAAFDTWQAQSGRSLTEISRVLAMSL
ncbi:MAG: DNA-3-methyladenine glycosylase I [Roseivivax sp.]|nr:DNA-3-methyladenine glycosylase I [Roseivivax sp.]